MSQSSPAVKKAWVERNKDHRARINRSWKLRMHYGISPERYREMFEEQEGACAICRAPFTSEPHIDHNHETKWVRGLLCSPCNTGLGMYRESPELLNAAAKYVTARYTPEGFIFSPLPFIRKHTQAFKDSARKRMLGNKYAQRKEEKPNGGQQFHNSTE